MALGSKSADGENIGNGPLASKGRDPKARGPKTVGGVALNDAAILVLACWVFLFVLAHTLRHHNH
jgi:hypothetical protein